MKKIEKLQLENEILKNMILCIKEQITMMNERQNNSENLSRTIGAIESIADSFEMKMDFAVSINCAIDYRVKK